MKKILLLSCLLIVLTGCSLTKQENKTIQNNLKIKTQSPVERIEEEKIDFNFNEVCDKKRELGLEGYESGKILQCGDYFRVLPPKNLMDAADLIIDKDLNKITYCGGMPKPENTKVSEECRINCVDTKKYLCEEHLNECQKAGGSEVLIDECDNSKSSWCIISEIEQCYSSQVENGVCTVGEYDAEIGGIIYITPKVLCD